LSEGSLVGSRGAHFAEANEALFNAMESSPEFAVSVRRIAFLTEASRPRGVGRLKRDLARSSLWAATETSERSRLLRSAITTTSCHRYSRRV
jgi:hypothetical protein